MSELEKLISGFSKFHQRYYEEDPELYKELISKGQSPKVLVIACCDSRVHPVQILNTDPGDIFVVRNVANIVPPSEDDGKSHGTSAAIEYAVKHLGIRHIIVLGHSHCGGIQSLMEDQKQNQDYAFIAPWMKIVAPAREKVRRECGSLTFTEQCRKCEQEAIQISVNNLMTFPWINKAVAGGDLALHGWYFDIEQGALSEWDVTDQNFKLIG